MAKKIIVDCCGQCPLVTDSGVCSTEDGARIEDMDSIPDWCPLEED